MAAQQLRDSIIEQIAAVLNVPPSYIHEFEFRVEHTPLSHIAYPFVAMLVFCVGIPWLAHFMRHRESPPLKYLILLHNLFLCVASGALALFMMITLYAFRESDPAKYDAFRIYCGLNWYDQRGALTFIYYVNYLLKYYELLDTVFLALKHKPLTFLHCYHHPATLVLTWGQLVDSTGTQWLVILLNLYVHTVMYFYYALAALRVRMPWKKLVTVMQITQFIIDLVACYLLWCYYNFYGLCCGHQRASIALFVLTSYLYLFIDFYDETYNNNQRKQAGKKLKLN